MQLYCISDYIHAIMRHHLSYNFIDFAFITLISLNQKTDKPKTRTHVLKIIKTIYCDDILCLFLLQSIRAKLNDPTVTCLFLV